MLLRRLYDYSFRLENLSPPGYSKKLVSWLIELDSSGRFLGLVPLTGDGKPPREGRILDIPYMDRTSGDRSRFIVDTPEYVLGLDLGRDDPTKVANRHRLYLQLLEDCVVDTEHPDVKAILAFCQTEDHALNPAFKGIRPGDAITFRVNGHQPAEDPSIRQWWAEKAVDPDKVTEGTCMVTGIKGQVMEVLPEPLTGIPGDQGKYYLCSVNKEAFESYGLPSSLNSPISFDAAERFGKTLNHLLASEHHSLRIGPLAYVFWTREESAFNCMSFLNQPDAGQVAELLKSAWKGDAHADADETKFYAAALSASGSRVVVRDWLETTVRQAKDSLARWFKCQELCDPFGDAGRPTGVYQLAASLYRDANKELVANVPRSLLRVALHGGALPDHIAAQAVRRNIAEQGLTQPRARLLKLWLTSQLSPLELKEKETYMTELDMQFKDAAYLCGRLLAVLESAQRLALGRPNATIVDRFYGSASTAPATVFGTLLKGAQAHLSKLRKTKPAVYYALSERLEQIMAPLGGGFPRTLALKQQALFSLGYYHQRAHDRAQAKAHKELRELDPEVNDSDSNEKEN